MPTDELTVAIHTTARDITALVTAVAVAAGESDVADRATSLVALLRLRDSLKRSKLKRRGIVSEREADTLALQDRHG